MGTVLIRDLDDAIITDYRRAAEANGRSLETELREALAHGRPKTRMGSDELVALSRRLWAVMPPAAAAVDSTPAIRAARDSR